MIDYSWEVINKFSWKFLPKVFPNTFKRKFSLTGDGIFDLVLVQDKVYHIKTTEVKILPAPNDLMTRDNIKNKILTQIKNNFTDKAKAYFTDGQLYFQANKWNFKVQIIKKDKIPS